MEMLIFLGIIYVSWQLDSLKKDVASLIEAVACIGAEEAPKTPPTNTPNRGSAGRPTVDRKPR